MVRNPNWRKNLAVGGTLGNKGGTGRPTDLFKAKCAKYIDQYQLIKFVADVAAGGNVENRTSENGELIKGPANVKDRLHATEMLWDRAFGKALQEVQHSGEIKTESEEERKVRRATVIAALREIAAKGC